jgi:hypothetical protein
MGGFVQAVPVRGKKKTDLRRQNGGVRRAKVDAPSHHKDRAFVCVYICIHIYMYTYIHTYIHTCINT